MSKKAESLSGLSESELSALKSINNTLSLKGLLI